MNQSAPSIAFIGTGALGGYYGGRLSQSGRDVHFLCHSDGPVIRKNGLIIESVGRSIMQKPVKAYDRVDDMPRCDMVIVSLKTTANHLLPDLLPHVVKPGGVVLVLQNGLNVEKDAAAAAPETLVIGGLCFLCANKPKPGYILHIDYDEIVMGWHSETGDKESADQWLRIISGLFHDAHIKTTIVADLPLARWKKLVWNIAYNGLSVIHKTTTDVMMADPDLRQQVEAYMREVQVLAAACGHEIEEDFIQKMLSNTQKMKPYKTSMLLDYEANKPLELEVMYERPLLAGEKAGASAPKTRAIWERLKSLT